jgi:2-hydroxy-6-oxonona-2,4-dienedioate hydrolase
MRKIVVRILKVMAGIVVLIAAFFIVVYVVNAVSTKSDKAKIESYGQLVSVDGKKMNVLIEGTGGKTIVLIPGFGTVAPVLDFKPLIEQLSPFFKIVALEPFGYGLSDETKTERTTEHIISEIHEALQQLNIHDYTLMGHSIAGIYALDYVNKYPDEVQAFVGIDTSVPTQDGSDEEAPVEAYRLLKKSGLLRLIINLGANPYDSLAYDEKTKKQLKLFNQKNLNNETTLNEMSHIPTNFKEAEGLSFPQGLPVLLLVQANNPEQANWIPLHEEQLKDSVNGQVIALDAEHYLHHTRSKEMADYIKQFMSTIQ